MANINIILEAGLINDYGVFNLNLDMLYCLNVDIISNTRINALANTMAKLNCRHEKYYLKKAKLIKEYASNSYPSVSKDEEKVNNLIITIELLLSYTKQVENLKSKLINKAKRSYMFNLINSINGLEN